MWASSSGYWVDRSSPLDGMQSAGTLAGSKEKEGTVPVQERRLPSLSHPLRGIPRFLSLSRGENPRPAERGPGQWSGWRGKAGGDREESQTHGWTAAERHVHRDGERQRFQQRQVGCQTERQTSRRARETLPQTDTAGSWSQG